VGVRAVQDCLLQGKVTLDYMRTQWIASSSVPVVGIRHYLCRNMTKNMGSLACANYFLVTYFISFVHVELLVIVQIFGSVGLGFKPD